MSEKKANKWDEKAKNYARYSPSQESFEADVLRKLESLGVDFKNKTVLDIGCGTGVYTIRVAKLAKSVDGLDFSNSMLEILRVDFEKLGIKNIKTYHTTWSDFVLPPFKYDIALCTMSPAIKTNDDLKKLHRSSAVKIYLGWAGVRDSTILDELFVAHGSVYSPPNGAKRVKKWLHVEGIEYRVENFEELKIKTRSFKEAVENYTWHLKIRGLEPDVQKIKEILNPLKNEDGNIVEKTVNKMDLIVW